MKIPKSILKRWKSKLKPRGAKLKCYQKTGISRSTINRTIDSGESNIGTFVILNKYFK